MDAENLRSPCSEEIRELVNPHFSFTRGRVKTPTGDLLFLFAKCCDSTSASGPRLGSRWTRRPPAILTQLSYSPPSATMVASSTTRGSGGSEIFEACFKLGKIFKFPGFKDWSLRLQRWGRDLDLRKGLLSGLWQDVSTLISTREADVIDENGAGIGHAEFLRLIGDPDDGAEQAALRWAVALNDRGRLVVQIQGLPASAASLNGKPSLRR